MGKYVQLIIIYKKQGYGQQAKGSKHIYLCRQNQRNLKREVAMGDIKSTKHHPNVKQLYFQTTCSCDHTHTLTILIQMLQCLTSVPKNIFLIPIISQHGHEENCDSDARSPRLNFQLHCRTVLLPCTSILHEPLFPPP